MLDGTLSVMLSDLEVFVHDKNTVGASGAGQRKLLLSAL